MAARERFREGIRGSATSRAPVQTLKPALAAAISRVWVLRLTAFALGHVQLRRLISDVSAG
jgi:hypothetical protein